MFAWFNTMGSEKKYFKIYSEGFSGLQIHHSFYLLSVLNRNSSPQSQKNFTEVAD